MTDAAALHEKLFKIDTHVDTPTARLMKPGWDFAVRHEVSGDGSQCDLPRMSGSIDAMVFAVFSLQGARTAAGFKAARQLALRVFERIHETIGQNAGRCALALTAADGLRLKAEGKRALYISIENAYSLGGDPANVARFHALGMRMLALTHMLNNELADSSTDPRGGEWGGLSSYGREVVGECDRLGIVVDASHASDKALQDLLEIARRPVILSHSGCRAVCDHPRNVGDGLLRELAAGNGVIQLNALPVALVAAPGNRRTEALAEVLLKMADAVLTPAVLAGAGAAWDRIDRDHPDPKATLDDFVRHIEHAVDVAGIGHVGVGCDFDGGGGVRGLNHVGEYPALTAALLTRGWDEASLAKLWGANTLRVFGPVQ